MIQKKKRLILLWRDEPLINLIQLFKGHLLTQKVIVTAHGVYRDRRKLLKSLNENFKFLSFFNLKLNINTVVSIKLNLNDI
jgi:hypothetical protein